MHRPLIILAAFLLVGTALYMFQPGLTVEEPRTEQVAIADEPSVSDVTPTPEPELLIIEDDVAVAVDVPAVPTFDIAPIEEEDTALIASVNSGLVEDSAVAPVQPTVDTVTPQDVASVSSATVSTLDVPTLTAPTMETVETIASTAVQAPVAPVVTDVETTVDLEVTRSRVVDVTDVSVADVVDQPSDITQNVQPVVPSQDILRSSSGSGALLLTAMAMGDDGVLRPSLNAARFGSAAITATMPEELQTNGDTGTVALAAPSIDTSSTRPSVDISASAPQVRVATLGSGADVMGFLASGAVATDELITTHRVQDGDSLAKLAIKYYGAKEAFIHIYQANRDVLSRPERISVGQRLRIPVVPAYQ